MGNNQLQTPVQYLKGAGPKIAQLFTKLGVGTVEDLLYFFPREYEDRREVKPIHDVKVGENGIIKGEIVGVDHELTRNRFSILKVEIADRSGSIAAIWFNQPYLFSLFRRGMKLIVSGKVEYSAFIQKLQFKVRDFEFDTGENLKIVPKYSLTDGLYPKKVRTLVKTGLDNYLKLIEDFLPSWVVAKYRLKNLYDAVRHLHFPENLEEIEPCRYRLAFEDFFLFQLGLGLRRQGVKKERGIIFKVDAEFLSRFQNKLPFVLTSAQKRVLEEIKTDMQSERPMNRLLQGDVGSGKTIVAAISALLAISNGYQVALMAPTEILAQQHYAKLNRLLRPSKIKCFLLTSSTARKPSAPKDRQPSADLIVGTHALIEERVKFKKLGLAIIDEQHRFGVLQRDKLRQKGYNPDVLFMTATPIPRSLALTLYGDLDRSVIDEMPPGRTPIKTYYISEPKRQEAYEFMRKQLKMGKQIFVVYPLVSESEKTDLKAACEEAERLQKSVFWEFKVGLIHGKMPGKEKDKIMQNFKKKKIQILVSTTVIEVGIDIPNATIMAIEHAERFGLSQLHQLRGRIGRGVDQSYCFLMSDAKTLEAKTRLKALLDSTDGFYLAEVDLRLRGPGDFYGVRQSGLPNFRVADLIRDEKILRLAREAAFSLLEKDPTLKNYQPLKEEILTRYGRFFGY